MSATQSPQDEQQLGFQTEVSQLLHLVSHSLYSHKEIFLRELIANASDAIDKLRFLALSNNELYEGDGELKIEIDFDADDNTITIYDNGIGMNRQDLIDNLGTIAKSGTRAFFEQLAGENHKDSELIGQFGVGFYSAFIVSQEVRVKSRKAGEKEAWQWSSDGKTNFTITPCDKKTRGTSVTLYLKEEEKELLQRYKLQQIITKYSDYISTPIMLWQEEIAAQTDDDGNIITEAQPEEYVQVNQATALWRRNKNDISDADYQSFYQHISHDFGEAAAWAHNQVEGKLEYSTLLYLPKKAPWDLFHREQRHGLKLFVQRVFIMDDAEQFLPNYLRFMKGVIDSNDLPLNVSRELLQDNATTQALKKACTKRTLTLLKQLAEDEDGNKYGDFWQQFGNVIKEGVGEDIGNRDEICRLLRFASTKGKELQADVSLDEYIARMQSGQDKIYYLVTDSKNGANDSPHLEIFRKNDIEVLLMWERIDEWMMSHLYQFEGKQFESINRCDISGELFQHSSAETDTEVADEQKIDDELLQRIQEVLAAKVTAVRVSKRLTKTPSCVVLEAGGMTRQMQELLKASGQDVPEQKYIFEINDKHPIVKLLQHSDQQQFDDWVNLLYGQALLAENGTLDDAAAFIATVNRLLS